MSEEMTEELVPKKLRILQSFNEINESEFWSQEIINSFNLLNRDMSFVQLERLLTRDNRRKINNINDEIRKHKNEYNHFLEDLAAVQNVFSYDVDYI